MNSRLSSNYVEYMNISEPQRQQGLTKPLQVIHTPVTITYYTIDVRYNIDIVLFSCRYDGLYFYDSIRNT